MEEAGPGPSRHSAFGIAFAMSATMGFFPSPSHAAKLNILHYHYTPAGESAHPDAKAAAEKALNAAAPLRDWSVFHTQDPAYFTDANLARFDVILFDNVCCKAIFDSDAQKAAVEKFMRSGKGYVGNHAIGAATKTIAWDYLWKLNGNEAYGGHPPVPSEGSLRVDAPGNYLTQGLPVSWKAGVTEWFNYPRFPAGSKIKLLVSIPKGSLGAGMALGDDLPVSWCQFYQGARSFYTSLGHSPSAFTDPLQSEHIFRALEWAGGRAPRTGECGEPVTGIPLRTPMVGDARVFAERFFSYRVERGMIRGRTLEPGRYRIEIFDERGRLEDSRTVTGAVPFSLAAARPGVHLLRLTAGAASFTHSFTRRIAFP